MRIVSLALLSMMCVAVTAAFTSAAEKTEVTLMGKATGAKCELGKTEKCQAALVVTEDGKEVVYYVKGKGAAALHKEVCKASKDGVSVTGIVTEKDGQKWITATKIES